MKRYQKEVKVIFVCHGKDCTKKGAKDLRQRLKTEVKKQELKNVRVVKCKCLDRCKMAPSLVYGQRWYGRVRSKDLPDILRTNS